MSSWLFDLSARDFTRPVGYYRWTIHGLSTRVQAATLSACRSRVAELRRPRPPCLSSDTQD